MAVRSWVALTLLGLIALSSTAAVAQETEEDRVKAVLTSLTDALGRGDSAAIGELVAGSGFVAVVGVMDQTMVLSKDEMLALMANSGIPVEFQDVKVSTHWMVALVSAKAVPAGVPAEGSFVMDAILIREAGKWKFASVCLCAEDTDATQEEIKAFVDRVATLPDSLKQGSVAELDKAVHDQRFLLALVDPSLEVRWATSKAAVTQMLQSVIPMVTVSESRLDVSRTVLGSSVAVVDGTWLLDISDFGETRTTLHAYAAKVNGEWKIVAIGGGPEK